MAAFMEFIQSVLSAIELDKHPKSKLSLKNVLWETGAMNEWMNEWMNQSIDQPTTNQPINKSIN